MMNTERVNFTMSEELKLKLMKLSQGQDMHISEFLRHLIREAWNSK
jgi:hypothetical protein